MFNHGGKDKLGRLRVKNVAGFVLFSAAQYEPIMSDLILKGGKGKKREREESRTVDTQVAEGEESKKKRRLQGMGMLGMLNRPGVEAGPSSSTMESDEDAMFD